jgi:hypothetical protein
MPNDDVWEGGELVLRVRKIDKKLAPMLSFLKGN